MEFIRTSAVGLFAFSFAMIPHLLSAKDK